MTCANHPDRERVAFCQNCGKPLCQECTRAVGSAVYCEPCLAARLAGTNAPPNAYAPFGANSASVNYVVDSVVPPPQVPGAPSPALATVLGFIPGVGAMYNGQYAKGIVHLVVFAILVSLANDVNNIFGLFVAGWIVYQAIDANHTARARLAGTPLPNPFGLNDLGERLGFGKAWPAAAPGTVPPAPGTPYSPAAAATFTQAADGAQTFTGADGSTFTQAADGSQAYSQPYARPYAPPASNWGAPADAYYGVPPVPPYTNPYTPVDPSLDPNASFAARNRFPAGALWLIGLGVFFLLGNSGIFHFFSFRYFTPFLLIGVGVWVFFRKMTDTGVGITDDGSPMYQIRLFRALRGSIWIVLVGVIFLLATFNILSWGHSWPLFIIVAGLMTLLERAAYSNSVAPGYPYPSPAQPVPAEPATTTATSTSIVPAHDTHDQEGS